MALEPIRPLPYTLCFVSLFVCLFLSFFQVCFGLVRTTAKVNYCLNSPRKSQSVVVNIHQNLETCFKQLLLFYLAFQTMGWGRVRGQFIRSPSIYKLETNPKIHQALQFTLCFCNMYICFSCFSFLGTTIVKPVLFFHLPFFVLIYT